MSDYTPITGELRKYATVSWDPWPDARERLYQMCNRIDAIHAGLERENAELKAELDRVTGEQEEHAHARGESITNELREYALGWDERNRVRCDLTAIADRIDAEHERTLRETGERIVNEWVCLPKDADGVPIHIGDVMEWIDLDGEVTVTCSVDAVGVDCFFAWDKGNRRYAQKCANAYRHHHVPTVEDVLREFALTVCKDDALTIRRGVVEEFAKRLTLAEGEGE